jgi:hypothetical protein
VPSTNPKTRAILEQASRYVILKSDQGVTVGIHADGGYGEAHSASNDLDAAVREAYDRALAAKTRIENPPT